MKTVSIILKILVALAAIAGVVYIAATYGNQIVAWCKKLVNRKCFFGHDDSEYFCDDISNEPSVAADMDFEG